MSLKRIIRLDSLAVAAGVPPPVLTERSRLTGIALAPYGDGNPIILSLDLAGTNSNNRLLEHSGVTDAPIYVPFDMVLPEGQELFISAVSGGGGTAFLYFA